MDHRRTPPPEELRRGRYFDIEDDREGNLSEDMWRVLADMVGNRNSVVVVDKETQQADWYGQGASEVEIPDLCLVDSHNPFAFARTYRRAMEGCLALRRSPVG